MEQKTHTPHTLHLRAVSMWHAWQLCTSSSAMLLAVGAHARALEPQPANGPQMSDSAASSARACAPTADKPVNASLPQLREMLPILNAKPGDVFAHATDRGNYLNPEMWYDVVVFKGIWDPETSDPKLVGWSRVPIPKGGLIFHWHTENPGNGGMFYQAGAWRRGIAITTQNPEGDDGVFRGCGGVGIALPLEDCWGMRTLEEFGLEDEEIEKYTRRHEPAQAASSE